MPRKSVAKATGVWEKEPGSGVWWIRYRVAGKLKREKVGRRSDAIDLYRQRKSEVRAGIKLPPNMRTSGVTFGEIASEAEGWYVSHGKKDIRNVKGRMKFLVKEFGSQRASQITPSQVDFWIGSHKDWSPATGNRYKALMSKTFKLAVASGKVASNPARLVEQRAEHNARIRFLSDGEEQMLRKAINKRCPDHMEEFDVALNTGMRKGEQYTTEWSQVSFKRKRLKLEGTKNGSDREIPMNRTCLCAFEALHKRRHHDGRVFQSKFGEDLNNPRSWFDRCLEDAGISNFTWHCLRHTFISRLVMKGVDLRTVQELAGHKTISMTARYAHLSSTHLDTAVEKLDAKAKADIRPRGSRQAA
ncbi:MAG: site-specific integrase [Acidobacteriaceae bacterium]